MGGQVGNTSNGVTLNFDIGTEHLAYEGLQATKFNDEKLVISCINGILSSKVSRES